MNLFLMTFLGFGAAFAAMAVGALRGRPLSSRDCGDCPARRAPEEGGMRCRP